jgi:putative CocE/NonD family hydrolase
MRKLAPDSFYHHWLHNYDPDAEYWRSLSPKYLLNNVDLPMLHVGGWFDPYLRGTMNLYRAMTAQCKQPQHLLIGPWAHLPWGRKLGAIDYGIEAQNPIDEIQIRWFDYWLKGKDTGLLNEPPISLFEMGSNSWREFDSLPDDRVIYYLASDGLASIREDSGMLWQYEADIKSTPGDLLETDFSENITKFENHTDILVHDPWRPAPALGGHATYPGGSFERSALDCRSDVVTYTSAPLKTELSIVGAIILEVYCTVDNPSFDLCAILSIVNLNGQVFNFTQGYTRVDSSISDPSSIEIPLQTTCICIPPNHSLRLSLSAACFPAYAVNGGTGKLPHESSSIDNSIITISIHSGDDYPSRLILSNWCYPPRKR